MRPLLHAALLAAAALLIAAPAAGLKRPRVKYQDPRRESPAARYAGLTKAACLKALSGRKIGFVAVPRARGVLAPVRLTGDVGGVLFRSLAGAEERATSPAEVLDCRLVLALHDWSKILTAHGIDEVRFMSAWRPPPATWPEGKLAKRHPGALALDVKRFGRKLAAGEKVKRWLSVEADFHGKIGGQVCGVAALPEAAKELRALVCEARDRRLFTSILTPGYDRAHKDHFHLEVRPAVAWSLFL